MYCKQWIYLRTENPLKTQWFAQKWARVIFNIRYQLSSQVREGDKDLLLTYTRLQSPARYC